jgi:hypothetical protein
MDQLAALLGRSRRLSESRLVTLAQETAYCRP